MTRALQRAIWALAVSTAACSQPAAEPSEELSAPIAVRVAPLRRGAVETILTVTGETVALAQVRLASPVAGRVTALAVQPGDHLQSGVTAARVLPLENESALHGLEVLAKVGALSDAERPLAHRIARDVGDRDIAIAAPFESVVADRLHNPGEQVAANDVLLELYDPRSLVVLAQVPVDAIGQIQIGQSVELVIGASRSAGRVTGVLATVAPQTLTIPVRIAPSAPLQPPLLHAAATCRITVAVRPDALLLPRRALLSSGVADEGIVMLAVGARAARRAVTLGMRGADALEVLAGLADGDWVITDGGFALSDGAPIAPQPDAN